ncbi:MAG: hypothetical protein WCF18_06685 [Chthoniobacteraceae bacterium]
MKLPGALFLASMLVSGTCWAVSLSSFDDFQSANTDWQNGVGPGIVSLGGGPAGPDDYFLQVPSYARGGVSSRLVIFNQGEWSGDYIGAGITQIEMDLANFGATDLAMRLAFTLETARIGYVSLEPMSLPADAVWRHFVFPIDASAFVPIGTTDTFVEALSNVTQFRILSQDGGSPTSTRGDAIEASLGVDNVAALTAVVPEPSTAWIGICVVALAAGFARPRRAESVCG